MESLIKDGWIVKTKNPSNHRAAAYQIVMEKLSECELNSSEQSSCELGSCELQQGYDVNSDGISCEQSSNPPDPLLGVTVINRQLTVNKNYPKDVLEGIYQAFPRRVGKDAALKAIGKALVRTRLDPEVMLQRVQAYAKSREGEDPQFTPYPATWFNQGRYEDEISTAKPNGGVYGKSAAQLREDHTKQAVAEAMRGVGHNATGPDRGDVRRNGHTEPHTVDGGRIELRDAGDAGEGIRRLPEDW